jgi:type I restriction enzyme R subunit
VNAISEEWLRLFDARLELIGELDRRQAQSDQPKAAEVKLPPHGHPESEQEVRAQIACLLHQEVAAMNLDNFVVRPQRRLVEKYANADAWSVLSVEALAELSHEVAGLPAEIDPENEEAKRFDLLALGLELALLHVRPGFDQLRDRIKAIAELLAEKAAIPMVHAHMALIQDVQTDEWWQDVTVPMLETMRQRLRGLVQFIDKRQRKPVYTDFEDLIGDETPVALPGFAMGIDETRFRAKVQAFLRQHLDHVAIAKLYRNKPLTAADIAELERMLVESGIGGPDEIRRAAEAAQGLGLFVRSLVGLDRGAAKDAMAGFIAGKALLANQLEFINLIVDHLTAHGVMVPAQLYESPFTDIAARGPDELFEPAQLDELVDSLDAVRSTALAA